MILDRTFLIAAAVVAIVSLSSCSSEPTGADEPSPSTSPSAEPPSKSPAPTGPCAEGTCEIEVAVGDVVEVPAEYGLGPIEITAITDERWRWSRR